MIPSQFNRPLRPPAVPAIRPPTFIGCRTSAVPATQPPTSSGLSRPRLCQRTWASTCIEAFVRRPPSMQPSACASGCLAGCADDQTSDLHRRFDSPAVPAANCQLSSKTNASAVRRATLRLAPGHDLPVVPAISISGLRRRFPSSECASGQLPACAGFPGSSVHSLTSASDFHRNPHPSSAPSMHTWLSPPIASSGWPAILFRLSPDSRSFSSPVSSTPDSHRILLLPVCL